MFPFCFTHIILATFHWSEHNMLTREQSDSAMLYFADSPLTHAYIRIHKSRVCFNTIASS